jgi:uncharacterized protein (TIGR02266 family)
VGTRHTILVVDDTSMFLELGALFLARSGRVLSAVGGRQGLEALRRERPDVVVADLWMPEMGGGALCRAVKSDPELREIPVILVTSGEDAGERAHAIRAGADDVIARPISRLALIQAVNRFLRSPRFRGLTRVDVETPVRIRVKDEHAVGRALNLSRGGIFVETEPLPSIAAEVELRFRLPGVAEPLAPTAQVIWHRERAPGQAAGMGLQFLAIDRASVRRIEDYIEANAGPPSPPAPPARRAVTP